MTGTVSVDLTYKEVNILVSALLNSDEFVPREMYETVMGNTHAEGWTLLDRLAEARAGMPHREGGRPR